MNKQSQPLAELALIAGFLKRLPIYATATENRFASLPCPKKIAPETSVTLTATERADPTRREAPSEQSTPEGPLKTAEKDLNARLDALRNELLTWCAKHEGDIQFLRLPVGTATVNVEAGKMLLLVPELAVAPMAK